MAENVRHVIEGNGGTVLDLHVWCVGQSHLSAVVSVATGEAQRTPNFYHAALKRFKGLSHITVEGNPKGSQPERRLSISFALTYARLMAKTGLCTGRYRTREEAYSGKKMTDHRRPQILNEKSRRQKLTREAPQTGKED